MDEWLQRMCVFQRGSYQSKQLSTSEIMGAIQKSESAVSVKTSDILQLEYDVPFFPHPSWPQSARDMTLRASYELRAH